MAKREKSRRKEEEEAVAAAAKEKTVSNNYVSAFVGSYKYFRCFVRIVLNKCYGKLISKHQRDTEENELPS